MILVKPGVFLSELTKINSAIARKCYKIILLAVQTYCSGAGFLLYHDLSSGAVDEHGLDPFTVQCNRERI